MNYSVSEENYLKAIYHLQEQGGKVTTSALAQKLHTRAASVTDMTKKLNNKNLLHYTPYYGFTLSNEGKKIALAVIRRHRLWEYFLADKLKFDWKDVHTVAEELEHVSSKKLIDKLDEYLGYPETDPHGDPIPDSRGKMRQLSTVSLNELGVNQPAEIIQVLDQSEAMLQHLKEKNITLGARVEVKKKFSFDQSLEIKLRSQTLSITHQLARNLFVKKL